ncbi:hypothetical protein MC885_000682 [Smutsia gigantea]|nr:hypothetical protein MC885_000682 [Smutsia gigantea]
MTTQRIDQMNSPSIAETLSECFSKIMKTGGMAA